VLADKDIDAALELIDAWNEGDVDAKGSLSAMSDRMPTERRV
jgi:hypothetical protein